MTQRIGREGGWEGGRLLASGTGRVARQWLGRQGMADGRGLCGIYPTDEACCGTIFLHFPWGNS